MFQWSIGEPAGELRAGLEREAHLWLLDLESWSGSATHPALGADDKLRARTIRHPEAQRNFLAGRVLVRTALSHYADIESSAWLFRASRLGRPEIVGPGSAPALRFNLSHSGALAACVVTATAACGVDVENLARPLRPLRIAEHSFAPEEFDDLNRRPRTSLRDRFFTYWTLKESYYKARGSGIPFHVTGARFELDEPGVIVFAPADKEETLAENWQFELFRPRPDHLVAVALEAAGYGKLTVRAFASGQPDADYAEVDLNRERSSSSP